MAKKSKAIVVTTQVQDDVAEPAAPEAIDRPDPTLLGVSVPLGLTFTATKQVVEAWRECFVALSAAVKARLAKGSAVPEPELELEPSAVQA